MDLEHRARGEPPDPGQRIHRHHGLHCGQPPRQVPRGAQRGRGEQAGSLGDLVIGEQVTVDGKAGLLPQITTRHGQLGVRVRRRTSCTEQLRRRVTRQHAPARHEQGRGLRPSCQIGRCAREQVCRDTGGDTGGRAKHTGALE
jgi:hypothetical protein